MKTSNKSTIITGITLLALAAFFTISLILQPLDFGAATPGHNNFFFLVGNIIFSVYGFSSILIPVFLLIMGLSCFATTWTARKTLRLLTAIIPFFTCVITENICRSVNADAAFKAVKIIVTLVTGIMLVIIEYLGIGIIADKLNSGAYKRKPNSRVSKAKETILEDDFDVQPASNLKNSQKDDFAKDDFSTDDVSTNDDFSADFEDTVSEPEQKNQNNDDDLNFELKPIKTKTSLLDKLKLLTKKNNSNLEDDSDDDLYESSGLNKPADTNISDVSAGSSDSSNSSKEEVIFEDFSQTINKEKTSNNSDTSATDFDENPHSSSMITQEEFAALTAPDPEPSSEPQNSDSDFSPADELEWNNLPPKPEQLPPEYDDSFFDIDDPALEFPPKDDDDDSFFESDNSDKTDDSNNSDDSDESDTYFNNDDSTPSDSDFDIDFEIDNSDTSDSNTSDFDFESETSEIKEELSPDFKTTSKPAKTYSDAIVENPAYGHGIKIHDDAQPSDTESQKTAAVPEKPKYPSKITFNSTPEPEVSDQDTYQEDETLPFPDFDFDEPAINSNKPAATANNHPIFEPTSDFDQTDDSDDEDDIFNGTDFEDEADSSSFNSEQVFNSATSTVFSDMENDIRRSQQQKMHNQMAANNPSPNQMSSNYMSSNQPVKKEVSFDGIHEVPQSNGPDLENPSAGGANNLTADELNDFFNAQQAENTPKTREIQANPPKIGNRATKKGPYVIPSDLLTAYKDDQYWIIDDATKQASLNLKQTLSEFNIEADITGIKKGPVVTMFEILPAPGVKLSKIVALQDNIALSLAAQSVRIVAPIPGKQAVGIEVPNRHRSVVGFREIIEMDLPEYSKMAVPVVLGKDILGKAQLIDLAKTPHMLIAGATGSGKSVCVNSLILSILFKRSPKEVKMILVDPKVVELKLYNNIPHLLTPVITEPKKALQALQWCLCEMERRYALLDGMGVRDISNYNAKIKAQNICTEHLPYIVLIIDEFADLMATSGKELETIVARLTAMSRAVGIHLVLATQRPSVNVITGLIKANIPTRIAFMVASRTDSNIIIDTVGAEKLLGRGDMLYASATDPAPIRIQGTFINDNEVEDVVSAVKEYGEPDYIDDEMFISDDDDGGARDLFGEPMSDDDPLYDQALQIVVEEGKASASYLQRRLKIGYNRAARLVEEMEERGIVGPANGSKPREVIHIP